MSAIESYEAEFRDALIEIFGRPAISGITFLIALPALGFPFIKSAVIAVIVFTASTCFVGRRSLHVAAVALVLYTIPVYLGLVPTPVQTLALIAVLHSENHIRPVLSEQPGRD